MFRGRHSLSVDSKGRLAIPKVHREKLEMAGCQDLILTVDRDRCLLLYPLVVWTDLEKKIMALPNTNTYNRILQRTYVGHATRVDLDKSNRMLIPATLREYASIDRNIVTLGQGSKLEIWSDEVWNDHFDSNVGLLQETLPEFLSEEVKGLSI